MMNVWMSSYAANSNMRPHSHDKAHFTVVLQGSYDEVIDSETVRHRSGSMLFYPAGRKHSQKFGNDGSRGLMFIPTPSCFDFLGEHGFTPDRAVHLPGGSISHITRRLVTEIRRKDSFTQLAVTGLLLESVAAFGRFKEYDASAEAPRWLLQVREMLQEESTAAWTHTELAARVGRHPVHLAKAFRKHFGETVGDFQRRRRLARAEMLLAGNNTSLLEIAFECGFSNQAHFSREFKNAFGITPSQYRLSAAHYGRVPHS